MERNEQEGMDNESVETNAESQKNTQSKKNNSKEMFNTFLRNNTGVLFTIASLVLFFLSLVTNFHSDKMSFSTSLGTAVIILFIIFAISAPVFIMYNIKGLRRFIIDEKIEDKNFILSENISNSTNNLQKLTKKLDDFIDHDENHIKKIRTHIDECPRITRDNFVSKSYMINEIAEYYKHLTKARQKADNGKVYLTSFSTRIYATDNKERNDYYLNDFELIKNKECQVYRIVTVHSSEKLIYLRELFDDAVKHKSEKYNLAYLDIEEFSDGTNNKLPDIVGMQIIGDEIFIMDFRYARALTRIGFKKLLYMESKETADMCREYYEMIWKEISVSNESDTDKSYHRYKGYILYDGTTQSVHKNIDVIWEEIENKILAKNQDKDKVTAVTS
jgi:hypothetical protein